MSDEQAATATAASVPTGARRRAAAEFWHYFSINTGAVIGLVVFVLLVLVAIFAPLIAPQPE